jgi:uncharacterized protein
MTITRPAFFRGMNPLSKLFFGAFVTVAIFLAVQLIAVLIALPLFGFKQVTEMLTGLDLNNPDFIPVLKLFQVFQTVGLFIVPALLLAWFYDDHPFDYLCLNRKVRLVPFLLAILVVFLINPFINLMGYLNAGIHLPHWLEPIEEWMRETEDTAADLTKAFLTTKGIGGLIFNLFMIAILPALGEELLFRGVIQKLLTQLTRSPHLGIWLSAGLFSALHMQFLGFIPRMLLGGMFGYLLYWSGSLWLPIIAHFINNAAAVIGLWLIDKSVLDPSFEEFGAGENQWYFAIASLILTLFALIAIRQMIPSQERAYRDKVMVDHSFGVFDKAQDTGIQEPGQDI